MVYKHASNKLKDKVFEYNHYSVIETIKIFDLAN